MFLEPRSQIEDKIVDERPVVPIQETVAYANEYYAYFQSAVAMFGRLYEEGIDIDATYRID